MVTEIRLLTKFRISAHNLKIERGRYLRLPVEERICVLCGGNVEDEIYFCYCVPHLIMLGKPY